MARLFIDGFESGQEDLWDAESGASVVSSAGLDMDGDYCLDLNNIYEYVEKDITADDEMYFAFLWRPTGTTSEQMIGFFNGATLILNIRAHQLNRDVVVSRGSYTEIASGTKTFSVNTTYLIEVYVKIADSGGRVIVKVDGVTDVDFTGDTKEGTNTQFNKVRLGYCGLLGYTSYAYFDNFRMDDADWIGDTNIQALVPTAGGNATNWTPSAGSNYSCIDEIPASDVDYVSINSNDVVDSYVAGDLVGSINSVKCVQVQSRTKKDGAPTPTNLKLVIRRSGTDYLSGDKTVLSSEKSLWNLWATDPSTSAAWLEAGVNAMELGIKSAA